MASLREIRRRLRSVENTKQIMRAMQLVAASKFKRAQARLAEVRGVMEFLDGLLQRVLAATPDLAHPLCAKRADGPEALVLFTSDAGLCGAYNTNLISLAESTLRRDVAHSTQVVFVGKRGWRHFTRRGRGAAEAYLDLAGRPDPTRARAIGKALMETFLSGRVSGVKLLYARFVSAASNRPTVTQWLPITLPTPGEARQRAATDYLFEPSAQRVFEDLLPRWALTAFQQLAFEAFTSEHSARMLAMKNATDNAEELVGAMTLQRNKLRQAAITKEISEISGTVEALR